MDTLTPDANPRNADWQRTQTWDLFDDEGLIDTADRLRTFLAKMGTPLEHFMQLPAAEAMPESVRAGLPH